LRNVIPKIFFESGIGGEKLNRRRDDIKTEKINTSTREGGSP